MSGSSSTRRRPWAKTCRTSPWSWYVRRMNREPNLPGKLSIIGLGPGSPGLLTPDAARAIEAAGVVVGYRFYLDLIADRLEGKEVVGRDLGEEVERARLALELAEAGRTVALISSGDAGVYGMGGVAFEVAGAGRTRVPIEVIPGVTAATASASLLGAPLAHDWACLSLSDLLTPWETIERRVVAAAEGDFVLAIYNPKSRSRDWQLARVAEILLRYRAPDTPVGLVENAYRPDQARSIIGLGELARADVGMFTTVIVGSSKTYLAHGWMITPRIYEAKGAARPEAPSPPNREGDRIMAESLAIIDRELGPEVADPGERAVVRRMIHASADFDFAASTRFGPGSIASARPGAPARGPDPGRRRDAPGRRPPRPARPGRAAGRVRAQRSWRRGTRFERGPDPLGGRDPPRRPSSGRWRGRGDRQCPLGGRRGAPAGRGRRVAACLPHRDPGRLRRRRGGQASAGRTAVDPIHHQPRPQGGDGRHRGGDQCAPDPGGGAGRGPAMSRASAVRPPFELIRGLTVLPRDPKGTREGYTTGASAAAAAQAACRLLLDDERPEVVAVRSPLGFDLMIPINRLSYRDDSATAGVIKDGGDDPDVTHGAEVLATVRRSDRPGVAILGGEGVGRITQPGLELPPGEAAINPVPRRMIAEGVLAVAGLDPVGSGFEVTIAVPGGEAIALKTLNSRIGILGGISILGTTGVVRPMSTASWRASVVQSIDVAAANSLRHVVLTTGGRSERFAEELYPALPKMAFVQMGIFTGDSLKRATERGVEDVMIGGMIGKIAKLATGQMQTHVAGGGVDVAFLADLARDAGAPPPLVEAIAGANTGRHVEDLVRAAGFPSFHEHVARRAAEACRRHVGGRLRVEVALFDFEGRVLALASDPGPAMIGPVDLIGMGAEGPSGLSTRAASRLSAATFLAGGRRHLAAVGDFGAERFTIADNVAELADRTPGTRGRGAVRRPCIGRPAVLRDRPSAGPGPGPRRNPGRTGPVEHAAGVRPRGPVLAGRGHRQHPRPAARGDGLAAARPAQDRPLHPGWGQPFGRRLVLRGPRPRRLHRLGRRAAGRGRRAHRRGSHHPTGRLPPRRPQFSDPGATPSRPHGV